MNEKITPKNLLISEDYARFPAHLFADAMMYIFASPPLDEEVNVLLAKFPTTKFQKKFYFTQKELDIFNNLKHILGISHDYQLAHIILNNSQQNPIFKLS